jgi:spore coat polysaccharide biosynthesis protein SpsF
MSDNDNRPLLVVTARAASTRLPYKVLKPIFGNYSLLEFLLRRLKKSYITSRLILSTGEGCENDVIEEIGNKCGVSVDRGPEEDVLERINMCVEKTKNVCIVGRVTADNPLTDPDLIGLQLEEMKKTKSDYSYCRKSPIGTAIDLWTYDCFKKSWSSATGPAAREHVNSWVWNHPYENKILWFEPPPNLCDAQLKVTIDTLKQFHEVQNIIMKSERPLEMTIPEMISAQSQKEE